MPFPPRPHWIGARAAAHTLLAQQFAGEHFEGLPVDMTPTELMQAYATQDAFLDLLTEQDPSDISGYKIAITTPAMQSFVGFDDAISGCVLARMVKPSGCDVDASLFQHLIVEFELAFQLGQDIPYSDQPWTASRILPLVECAYPCLELADDRHANYNHLKKHFFTLVAENAWNHGAILGDRIEADHLEKLWQTLGVARVNGEMIGQGKSQDVMGHPLNALAWLANECQRRGRPVLAGQWVTTGSWVASFFPVAGQTLRFDFDNLAGVDVHIV